MKHDESPTARALLVLELLQNQPGITAARLAERLRVSERAARRYVAILREAGIPVEATRGPHGGYRVGRGLRLPPLMFTATEALGLVMAVLDSEHMTAEPVAGALGKLMRVLPEPVAAAAEAVLRVSARTPEAGAAVPSADVTAVLVRACADRRRLRLTYRAASERAMVVDPWAVVVRRGRWYLLCWSHTSDARRVLRVDRVVAADVLDDRFVPPEDLDPAEALAEHLAEGWRYRVEVVVDAPADDVAGWWPRNLGRCEAVDAHRTRIVATTDEPDWYAVRLLALKAPFHIVRPPELRKAAEAVAARLTASIGG